MMDARWRTALDLLVQTHFADLAGARLALTLPVSDRLLTALARAELRPSGPVRDVDLIAETGNQIAVRVRLTKPAFLPPLTVRLRIESQPILPDAPVLRLHITSRVAAFAAQLLATLPPWLRLRGDRLEVDLAALARQYGAIELFQTLSSISLATVPGTVVLDLTAALPPPTSTTSEPSAPGAVYDLNSKQ